VHFTSDGACETFGEVTHALSLFSLEMISYKF